MSKMLQHEADTLVNELVDEYIRNAVDEIDVNDLTDEDAYYEALSEIEYCLKHDMQGIVKEATNEARVRFDLG